MLGVRCTYKLVEVGALNKQALHLHGVLLKMGSRLEPSYKQWLSPGGEISVSEDRGGTGFKPPHSSAVDIPIGVMPWPIAY